MPRAIVNAMANGDVRESSIQARADEDGRFELRGLLPGPTLISADGGEDLTADPVLVDVTEEDDSKSIVLLARAQLRLSGNVVSAAGPVPGARVKAAPAGLPYISVRVVPADAQGHFEVTLPPPTREILLTVSAPGFALRTLRLPVPEDRTLNVGVEQSAGTLIVEPGEPLDLTDPNSPMIFLLHGGSVEALPYLLSWAISTGTPPDARRPVIPAVEPGAYQACLVLPSERPALDFGITPPDRCVSGILASNGELTLKVSGIRKQ